MINALIRFSLIQRLMILLLALGLTGAGIWAFNTLPIDAFTEISATQERVVVKAPGLSPTEVESRITFPIEVEMQGLPRQTLLRSTTNYALCVIVIDFEDGTDIYWARQQVAERLNQVWGELPAEVEGGLGPITTLLGEGYMYRVEGEGYSNQELRRIQDWVIRPRLRGVEGVAFVFSLGGDVKVYEVVADPVALAAHGLRIDELETALQTNNRNAGGDRINRNNEVLLVRTTVEGAKQALEELKPALPKGIEIIPFYDRTELVNDSVWTVEKALGEAVILVLIVLLVMLGNLRSDLTVALILPLSVLFTFVMMRVFGIGANLMSLGGLAIAIGILVDAAVVVVENIHTHLSHAPKGDSRLQLDSPAADEVATPVISGILIIIVVFLPLFSLSGLEGKMFTPLAVTISFALLGSLLLSLTVLPVLASLLMRGGSEEDGRLLTALKNLYLPVMRWALRQRKIAVGGALAALMVALALFLLIGKEFMPVMDEGTTVVIIEKLPSISLERSLELDEPYQKAMMALPEVTGVVSRTGADELRLDPMDLNQTDNFLITKPRDEWTVSVEEFQTQLREKLDGFAGIDYAFTQPIDMRVSEMLTGVRAAMAIKLYGDDLALLEEKSKQVEELVKAIPGAVDVFREQLSGQIYLQIEIKPEAIARFGINAEAINKLIEVAVGGRMVTEVIEESQRIGVLLRYPEQARTSPEAIAALLVETPAGDKITLAMLAEIREVDGPVGISRESAKRQVVVQANVEGRDVVGFVDEVRTTIQRKVKLPDGYYITYGGQFENQQRAAARLALVVPIAGMLIFLMLSTTFRSLLQAGLIILNIPFAMIGGVISLYLSGFYLSVPASVGFITLFGVAVLNGVVMVSYFNQLREAGRTVLQAVQEGAERRLRPVLMTALIASLGLVPLLAATGPGSELQRPLAVVVIGGLITSTLLTLILLPTLYAWLEGRAERNKRESL